MATVLTPNIPEAEVLSGMKIETAEDMSKAAAAIGEKYSCAVLCKGGHQLNDANDLLWRKGDYKLPCSFVIIVIMGKIVNKVLEYNKYQA